MRHRLERAKNGTKESILIEKNKKKVKIPYAHSRIIVMDMLETLCRHEDNLRIWHYNIEEARYTRTNFSGHGQHLGHHMYEIISACEHLINGYDDEITDILYEEPSSAIKAICVDTTNLCKPDTEFPNFYVYDHEDGGAKARRAHAEL
mmetsp:Transcript_66260/g.156482  ORF Transcript_66260/g.156482 Transcript_66260/m.156482 type:complete len:148 (-) Transcript_66260:8-451(-)